jgi:hypothetical protein
MKKEWDFGYITYKRDRSFNLYSKIEDHANDVHDYLKYLKFGYGRATDDASMEIRHGRITRQEGLKLIKEYDSKEPRTLEFYCDFLGLSKNEFYKIIEPMRDPDIWEKIDGEWAVKDACWFNCDLNLSSYNSEIFKAHYKEMYFNENNLPAKSGEEDLDVFPAEFKWA